jgi:ParB family chromosome partitioning protein
MQQLLEVDRLSLSEHRTGARIPRDTPSLRRSIQDHGFVDPIVVRPIPGDSGRYEILSNPESYVAAGKLGIHRVPVVIRDDVDDEEAAEIVRAQYDSLKSNPIEEAELYNEKLAEFADGDSNKSNIAKVARLTGKSRSHVSRALALLTLPLDVQEYFRRGELSAAHGRFLVKLSTPAKQRSLAARAVKEKLSVRDLESVVNKTPKRRAAVVSQVSSEPPPKDPDTLRLERDLTAIVGSNVTIDPDAGTVTINYFKNYETLDGILQKLGYTADS